MTPRVTFAVAARVLAQLRRDHRTVAMLIVLPAVLVSLMWWMFIDSPNAFDRFGGPLLAVFPAIIMFVVTSVATLRERSSGTLSRLFTMPMAKLDFLLGYALAFALIAVVQAVVVVSIALYALDLKIEGPAWQLGVVAVLDGVLGTALGLFASAFAATEFQAVQMMPAVMIPQILLCGLLVPRDQLPARPACSQRRTAVVLRRRRGHRSCPRQRVHQWRRRRCCGGAGVHPGSSRPGRGDIETPYRVTPDRGSAACLRMVAGAPGS